MKHITPTHWYEYEPGTKHGEGHGSKSIKRSTNINQLWHMSDGEFVYYLTPKNEVKYREHRNATTKKVDYAEEYYPGTVYGRDNIANGKKSIYIKMTNNRDEIVAYRARIGKNTQQWTEVEEYKKALKWNYGFPYEAHFATRFFVEGDKTLQFAYVYEGDYRTVSYRLDYYPGTKYDNHKGNAILLNRYDWSIKEGDSRIYMNKLGEVKYVEHISRRTGKVASAVEYYSGTIYKRDSLDRNKSIYIQMTNDTQQIVRYRALIDQKTQAWHQIEEYKKAMAWSYGTWYEREIEARFFIHGDRTIKYADVYLGGHTKPTHLFKYQSGTKYGEGHGGKIISRTPYEQPKPQPKWVWPVNSWTISTNYLPDPAPCDSWSGGPNCYPHEIHGGRHFGLDIAAPTGTHVWSASEGEIIASGKDDSRGNYIIIRHEGNVYSNYYHLSGFQRTDGWVVTGELIGYVGSTGAASGPHLHFQMGEGGYSNGHSVNPAKYIPNMKWNYSTNIIDMIIEQEEKRRKETPYMMNDFLV